MTNVPSPLKDAIMDAVYTPLERDDMQTPCTLPFMTSSEHGVCDGDGCPVSDETIASALNAVARIQTEYNKLKKETQKETQKEMTDEASPRPWRCECGPTVNAVIAANGAVVVPHTGYAANAALIVDAVNLHDVTREDRHKLQEANEELFVLRAERDRLNEDIESWRRGYIKAQTERNAFFLERDRLRDIVKRMANLVGEAPIDWFGESFVDTQVLLREARAAIGEDKE